MIIIKIKRIFPVKKFTKAVGCLALDEVDDRQRGLFATRAPSRPNPIGLSVVRLIEITDNTLRVEDIDVVDGTPLLDIKPYVPAFDAPSVDKTGWLAQKTGNIRKAADDGRFSR